MKEAKEEEEDSETEGADVFESDDYDNISFDKVYDTMSDKSDDEEED